MSEPAHKEESEPSTAWRRAVTVVLLFVFAAPFVGYTGVANPTADSNSSDLLVLTPGGLPLVLAAYLVRQADTFFSLRNRHQAGHFVAAYNDPQKAPVAASCPAGSADRLEWIRQLETGASLQDGPYVVVGLSRLCR